MRDKQVMPYSRSGTSTGSAIAYVTTQPALMWPKALTTTHGLRGSASPARWARFLHGLGRRLQFWMLRSVVHICLSSPNDGPRVRSTAPQRLLFFEIASPYSESVLSSNNGSTPASTNLCGSSSAPVDNMSWTALNTEHHPLKLSTRPSPECH